MSETAAIELKPEKQTKLAKRNGTAIQTTPDLGISPHRLSELALDPNVDAAKLAQLLEIQLRWEANEARKKFEAAMVAVKDGLPDVLRNKHVKYVAKGQLVEYDYPTLDNVVKTIAPVLAKNGLSHKWTYPQPKEGCVKVSCVISGFGHSEVGEPIECKIEDPMGMGAIKALSATKTMLERLTFSGSMGIASRGADTDGPEPVKELPGIETMLKAIAEAPDTTALNKIFKESYSAAKQAQQAHAMLLLANANDKRKGELTATEAA